MESKHLTCNLIGCKRRKEIDVSSSGNRIYYCPIRDAMIGGGAHAASECLKLKPQLMEYWEKRDLLGEKILESLIGGPKSVREIATSIGMKMESVGLKIKHELEPLGVIKYDDAQKRWLLN